MSERTREVLSWLTAGIVAALAVGALSIWYLGSVTQSPSRTIYQHPRFVDRYVESREAAQVHELVTVEPGQHVWRWVEYCLDEPMAGIVTTRWVGEHYRRFGRQVPNWGEVGCYSISTPTQVPEDVPRGREISLLVTVEFPREVVGSLFNRNPPITAKVSQ